MERSGRQEDRDIIPLMRFAGSTNVRYNDTATAHNEIQEARADNGHREQNERNTAVSHNIYTFEYEAIPRINDNQICSICLSVFAACETVFKLPCSHIFHKNCIEEWLRFGSTCPNCRYILNTANESKSFGRQPNPL